MQTNLIQVQVLAALALLLVSSRASAVDPAAPQADVSTALSTLLATSGPSFQGCPVYPASNEYNRDISNDAVDPHSSSYMALMGAASLKLHPDFGLPQYGMPFVVVGSTQAKVPMRFTYATESDPGPYPYPLNVVIQPGDRHAVVFDKGSCKLYETYGTARSGSGFSAMSGARFDLRSNTLRPEGWTSATAAGLPIFPGMVRYDEAVTQGVIRHALAFEGTNITAHAYVHPAVHSAGTSNSPWAPPMGTRVRLKKSFDLTRFHGTSLVILKALQRYGMFLIDNHTAPFWSLSGAQDAHWPVADLQQLKTIPASAFEVVKLPGFHTGS